MPSLGAEQGDGSWPEAEAEPAQDRGMPWPPGRGPVAIRATRPRSHARVIPDLPEWSESVYSATLRILGPGNGLAISGRRGVEKEPDSDGTGPRRAPGAGAAADEAQRLRGSHGSISISKGKEGGDERARPGERVFAAGDQPVFWPV